MPTNAINDTGVKYLYDKLHGEIEPIAEAVSDSEVIIEGNPLSFNTLSSQNAKSTILSLEPIQDLHGYDKPWVGGAGKNKLGGVFATTTSSNVKFVANSDGTVTAKNTSNGYAYVNSTAFDVKAGTYIFSGVPTGNNKYILALYENGVVYSQISNGATVSITIATDTTLVARCVINGADVPTNVTFKPQLELGSTATSYEPYENICPISGRSEVDILGCGKNLYIGSPSFDGYANVGLWTKDTISYNGHDVYKRDTAWGGMYKRLYLPVGTYVFSLMAKASANITAALYLTQNSDLGKAECTIDGTSNKNISQSWERYSIKFTVTSAGYVSCRAEMLSDGKTLYISEYQLEYGETQTPYTPYIQSTSLQIQLGQTVYGGQLDVENGVLVVDRAKVDLGTISYTAVSANDGTLFYSSKNPFPNMKNTSLTTDIANALCEFCIVGKQSDVNSGLFIGFSIGPDEARIRFFDNTVFKDLTATEFAEAISGYYLCYELATPITINLTLHTINLLKGVNNISTDGDKITLTYRDGSVATLGDLTSAVDSLDSKIDESKILTDTATGDKYILVVTSGVLSIEQISN